MNTVSSQIKPTVSVCIPTYLGASHLAAAIESVLQQSYIDFELIIIDDNSPDRTFEIVSSYRDNRIRYIKNPTNLGPEGNWNKCLAEAKGQYIKLLPHDDVLHPECLKKQVQILDDDTGSEIAFVFCARRIINQDGTVIATRGYQCGKPGVINSRSAIKKCIRMGTNLIGEPGAVLFRKYLSDRIGEFDGSISYIIDLDYWFRLLLHGQAYYLDAALASFRVAVGSWSIDIGSRQSEDFNRFIDRCLKNPRFELTGLDAGLGMCFAKLNNYLRLVFYKLVVSR